MAQLLSWNPQISISEWRKALAVQARPICGMPQDMTFSQNTSIGSGQVHCIEPMLNTVKDLRTALNMTKLNDSLVVLHAAISNFTGTAMFPNSVSGEEGFSIKDCEIAQTTNAKDCTEIPVFSLDDYVDKQGVPRDKMTDMLLVDAEGFDYEVLQGAAQTLRRVRYLLFEVHISGNWMNHSLSETIDVVLQDFNCYWAGKGRLWRITNCMNRELEELYDYKSWSNIACVNRRETELADIMEGIFLRTVPSS